LIGFFPPRSPHSGGLWEAAVKIAKHHFYRTVGTAVQAFEELRTLVCHISAVNSRPLVSISRFLSPKRKLNHQPALKAQNAAFEKEYSDLGHMSSVSATNIGLCRYFLPHHCVIKEDSSTTKLSVVFDGPAASSSGYSFNDALMAGPVIHPKLFQILLRFRSHPVAITGDICKM